MQQLLRDSEASNTLGLDDSRARSAGATPQVYPESNLAIISVNVPSEATPGDTVSVSVTVKELGTPSSVWTAGWVVVESAQFGQPILWDCKTIQQGSTETISSSTLDGTFDGEFVMPSISVDLDVTVGGFADGSHCSTQLSNGTTTDTARASIQLASSGGGGDGGGGGGNGGGGGGPDRGAIGMVVAGASLFGVYYLTR